MLRPILTSLLRLTKGSCWHSHKLLVGFHWIRILR
jgi:hypothetical protein